MTTGLVPTAQAPGRATTATLLARQVRHDVVELWRSRLAFVFTFLFPLTWLVVIGLLAGNDTVDTATGVRVMQFVVPSAMTMGVLFATLPTVATNLASARESGVLKRAAGTPLPAWVFLAGRVGASVVLAAGSFAVALLLGVLAYGVIVPGRALLPVAGLVVLGVACFAALGLAVGFVATSSASAQAASIAAVVALSFVSGLYTVGGQMPEWVDRAAAVFPVRPFAEVLRHQLDPYAADSTGDLGRLAVIAVWGVLGAVVALRTFHWEPAASTAQDVVGSRRPPALRRPVPALRATTPTLRPETGPRPAPAALLRDQVWWAVAAAVRDPGWMFFGVALPVGLYAFFMAMGQAGLTEADGTPVVLASAAGMTTWGLAVTAFLSTPEAVARLRDRGVLKRLTGTPLPWPEFLLGRTAAAVLVVVLSAALVLAVGRLFYGLDIAWAGLPLAAGFLLLGTLSCAACGYALMSFLPSSRAMSAVGLAVLLPLSFFSDIFVTAPTPAWMTTVGSLFPLRHLVQALTRSLDPRGSSMSWTAAGVILAWLLGAGVVAVARRAHTGMRWEGEGG